MKRWLTALLLLCLLVGCAQTPEAPVTVPDVVGLPADRAVTALEAQGLTPVVKYVLSTEAVDTVLQTDPPAGAHVAACGTVYLHVAATQTAAPTAESSTATATTITSTETSTTTVLSPSVPTHTTTTAYDEPTEPTVTAYAVGETWTVDGQWAFTIDGVIRHTLCNATQNRAEGYTDETVVTIRYTYENHGYSGAVDTLCPDGDTFIVTDAAGNVALTYGCAHRQRPLPCAVGDTCTAEEVYVLTSGESDLILTLSLLTAEGRIAQARFLLTIT